MLLFQFKNLEKPYATNCTMKTLKTFPIYTAEGCFYECEAEKILRKCDCRLPGYKGRRVKCSILCFLFLFVLVCVKKSQTTSFSKYYN